LDFSVNKKKDKICDKEIYKFCRYREQNWTQLGMWDDLTESPKEEVVEVGPGAAMVAGLGRSREKRATQEAGGSGISRSAGERLETGRGIGKRHVNNRINN
jgi:hypothetical protein